MKKTESPEEYGSNILAAVILSLKKDFLKQNRKRKLRFHTKPLGAAVGQCRASSEDRDSSASRQGFPAQPPTEKETRLYTGAPGRVDSP